jgi:hypothetical protein
MATGCCDSEIERAVAAQQQGEPVKDLWFGGRGYEAHCLTKIASLTSLESLILEQPTLTDHDLASVTPLGGLRRLELRSWSMTGEGLRHLAELTKLEVLWLRGADWGDDSIASIRGLTNLRELELRVAGLSERCLIYLQDMNLLEELTLPFSLNQPGLPDLLGALQHLPNLKMVSLLPGQGWSDDPDVQVDPVEEREDDRLAEEFRQALPRCALMMRV